MRWRWRDWHGDMSVVDGEFLSADSLATKYGEGTMDQPITVYVVDDDPDGRVALSAWFASSGFRAIELGATEVSVGVDVCRESSVVLRLDPPAGRGEIKFDRLGPPTIVVGEPSSTKELIRLISSGAAAFVRRSELQTESTLALIRSTVMDDQPTAMTRREAHESGQNLQKLTSRERLILRLVCEGKPTKWIASHLRLGTRTIETCRSAIVEKFGVETWSEVIAKVNRHLGFRHDPLAAIHSDAVAIPAGLDERGPPHASEESET